VPHRLGYETQGPYNDRRQTLALSTISRSMRLIPWAAKKPTSRRPAVPPPSGMRWIFLTSVCTSSRRSLKREPSMMRCAGSPVNFWRYSCEFG
jgi:hypothetical protein